MTGKQMKRTVTILVAGALLLLVGGFSAFSALEIASVLNPLQSRMVQIAEAKPPRDVVVINCVVTTTVTGSIVTNAFSSSANAPSVPLAAGCAQSLADLIDAGFDLADDSGGNFFTLER